ncbi:Putative Tyrosine protein kinase [[Torrubiella] hemipterigena]|uniref:EKC/KEOPS complex subunit BUD32 n=1 Tax=[Torrubiella] hemipterigena TaxID=1531966 RepID=A0A0A1TNX7_9HYPO|nr:Putative Tyrosine protein kinase [[Torrubiella] hemipterigena]
MAITSASNDQPFPLPAILQHPASTPPTLITQGAEGRLYKTTYLHSDIPCALKYRPPKPWRHSLLDQRLTKHRILSEARVLVKCRRDGVRVPAVYGIDEAAGWIMLEWINGTPVRVNINAKLGKRTEGIAQDEELKAFLRKIGAAVGKMHNMGIVHGDLTTSNMMLSKELSEVDQHESLEGEIVIIDMGLASGAVQEEERAVDLYVLERAFASTHPRAECIFNEVLEEYGKSFKQAPAVLKRLEDVRMRGRKRSMLG